MKVEVRSVRPSDKEPLMSFIKNVWGGHDYIPRVWDDWIRDTSGKMFVLEADGKPVAMNRVRFLEDGSAWLEGARVHPDYRGRGLATLLGQNSMEVSARRGVKVYRLTSSSWNRSAHRQVARMQFHEVSRVSVYEPRKRKRFHRQHEVRVAATADLDSVRDMIWKSKEYRLGGGMMWDSFTAVSLTDPIIVSRVKEGSVFLSEGAVAIARPGREGRGVWNQICFLAGEPTSAVKLVKHLFGTKKRADWHFVFVPQRSPLIGALRQHGLERAFSLVLFEKRAVNG